MDTDNENMTKTVNSVDHRQDLAQILDKLISEVQEDTSSSTVADDISDTPHVSDDRPQGSGTALSDAANGLLSSLLSNPEMLSKLPQLLGVASSLFENLGNSANTNVTSSPIGKDPPINTSALLSGISFERHTALLCALKPYLNNDRQRAAEYIIQLCKIGNVLKAIPPYQNK